MVHIKADNSGNQEGSSTSINATCFKQIMIERNEKRLQELLKIEENKYCADCGQKGKLDIYNIIFIQQNIRN